MKEPQAPTAETVEDFGQTLDPNAGELPAGGIAGEQPTEVPADPAEMLRLSMAHNFIQHCINAAVADPTTQGTPLIAGVSNAVSGLLLSMLRSAPAMHHEIIGAVANSLEDLRLDDMPLSQILMGNWAISLNRHGAFNRAIGHMQDMVEKDRIQAIQRAIAMSANEPAQPAEAADKAQVEEPAQEKPKDDRRKKKRTDNGAKEVA